MTVCFISSDFNCAFNCAEHWRERQDHHDRVSPQQIHLVHFRISLKQTLTLQHKQLVQSPWYVFIKLFFF